MRDRPREPRTIRSIRTLSSVADQSELFHTNNNDNDLRRHRRGNDDSELPRISANAYSAYSATFGHNGEDSAQTSSSPTSPLLYLLDGVLSRDETRVAEAMHVILHEYKVVIANTTRTSSLPSPLWYANHPSRTNVLDGTMQQPNAALLPVPTQEHSTGTHFTATSNAVIPSPPSVHQHAHVQPQTQPLQPPLHYTRYGIESPCTSSMSLCIVINALLQQYPHLAHIASDHDGSLPLHFAASLGNVPVAISILRKYPPAATKPNQKGKIPLHYAAREGRVEMVKYFLRVCPETCTIATDKGKLAIHFAAGDGHTEITSTLVQFYPESAAISSHKGKRPLHFCARWGYMDIAYELTSIYPHAVRALDWEGSLPIHDAAREGQYMMAKYLMNQYPASLQTSNLRGEIPLFPAVRSACMELIVLMIQSWPMSGKYVLRNVSAEDHISSWNWDIIEVLLRGATNNLYNCSLLDNHEAPTFRLLDDVQPIPVATSYTLEEQKAQKKARKAAALASRSTTTDVSQNQVAITNMVASTADSTVPSSMTQSYTDDEFPNDANSVGIADSPLTSSTLNLDMKPPARCPSAVNLYHGDTKLAVVPGTPSAIPTTTPATLAVVRCKSPILESNSDEKKASLKRSRKNESMNVLTKYIDTTVQPQRAFIPIHAAFECKSSYHVIERVLQHDPLGAYRIDAYTDRNVLHYAVTHCNNSNTDSNIIDLILDPNNHIITSHHVRGIDSITGQLPLHIAIEHNAHVRVIKALLHEYPTSGVTPCNAYNNKKNNNNNQLHKNEFYYYDKTPVYMAIYYNCDVSTIYELLRVDPSFCMSLV
jgi:ankyrin repeat protein